MLSTRPGLFDGNVAESFARENTKVVLDSNAEVSKDVNNTAAKARDHPHFAEQTDMVDQNATTNVMITTPQSNDAVVLDALRPLNTAVNRRRFVDAHYSKRDNIYQERMYITGKLRYLGTYPWCGCSNGI